MPTEEIYARAMATILVINAFFAAYGAFKSKRAEEKIRETKAAIDLQKLELLKGQNELSVQSTTQHAETTAAIQEVVEQQNGKDG